jgi:hypothetical protein
MPAVRSGFGAKVSSSQSPTTYGPGIKCYIFATWCSWLVALRYGQPEKRQNRIPYSSPFSNRLSGVEDMEMDQIDRAKPRRATRGARLCEAGREISRVGRQGRATVAPPGETQLAIALARRALRENNIPTVAEYRLLARALLRHLALSE